MSLPLANDLHKQIQQVGSASCLLETIIISYISGSFLVFRCNYSELEDPMVELTKLTLRGSLSSSVKVPLPRQHQSCAKGHSSPPPSRVSRETAVPLVPDGPAVASENVGSCSDQPLCPGVLERTSEGHRSWRSVRAAGAVTPLHGCGRRYSQQRNWVIPSQHHRVCTTSRPSP